MQSVLFFAFSFVFFLRVNAGIFYDSGDGRSLDSKSTMTTRCYPPYGCYSIAPPWTSSYRPITPFPKPPEEIAPFFCLYTRNSTESCSNVSTSRLVQFSSYQGNRSTVIVTHGYLENGRKKWIKRMVKELLLYDDYNVIVLDWVNGAAPPYTQAAANIRLVGTIVAHHIAFLAANYGPRTEKFHIIGHSLGSHLAGYAGVALSELGYTLGRISGLDPAEPFFEGTDELVRLDPTDALFVDVIHTDGSPILSGGLGLMQPSGHLDFYPNGGTQQPGCGGGIAGSIEMEQGSLVYGLRRFIGCNHIRAYEFFTESIGSKCPFLAVECPSWEKFRSGECSSCGPNGSLCHVMGMRSYQNFIQQLDHLKPGEMSNSIKAYLLTGPEKPFCRFHYRITVTISDTRESMEHGDDSGLLYLTLFGAGGRTSPIRLNEQRIYFEPGVSYSFMIGSHQLGTLESGIIEWRHSRNFLNPFTWRIASEPGVYLNQIQVECLETGQRFLLCAHDTKLTSGLALLLKTEDSCRKQEIFGPDSLQFRQMKRKSEFFTFF